MDIRWSKGYKGPQEIAKRRKKVLSYSQAFKELSLILEGLKKTPTKTDYDCPSWPYLRADMDGFNRAVTQVLSLIDIKE